VLVTRLAMHRAPRRLRPRWADSPPGPAPPLRPGPDGQLPGAPWTRSTSSPSPPLTRGVALAGGV